MEYSIEKDFGKYVELDLEQGEYFYTEPGALVSIEGDAHVESQLLGGVGSALLRGLGGGESLFLNKVTANSKAKVIFSSPGIGDIKDIELDGEYILGDGAYIGHIGNIELSSKFGGFNSLISGSGLLFLMAKGKGILFISGYGHIIEKELKEGETILVDNSNFLAAESHMRMDKVIIGKGLASKFLSGEGAMFKIHGPGKVYYRTHSTLSFATLIARILNLKL